MFLFQNGFIHPIFLFLNIDKRVCWRKSNQRQRNTKQKKRATGTTFLSFFFYFCCSSFVITSVKQSGKCRYISSVEIQQISSVVSNVIKCCLTSCVCICSLCVCVFCLYILLYEPTKRLMHAMVKTRGLSKREKKKLFHFRKTNKFTTANVEDDGPTNNTKHLQIYYRRRRNNIVDMKNIIR